MNRKHAQSVTTALQQIPSVQDILSSPSLQNEKIAHRYLKEIVQTVIDDIRDEIRSGKWNTSPGRDRVKEKILQRVQQRVNRLKNFSLKPVINGTGIILHTNLGRAPLAPSARQHLQQVIENYCNLEIDLESGKRGDRIALVEEMICLITGAEAAVVVNNNAAAILLALNSLSRRKEVPVSRGELVEIGGSFRMPEVMKASGAKMVEVGTTNKTHLKDYQNAITPRTGAILKVHTSNYRVLGFTASVPIRDLVELAHRHQLPLIYDMGSGVIEDLQHWGYPHEPVAREYVEAGVDVITFSGDKILGGPQAGIIIGKKAFIQKIRRNHLLRALRCDKLTYALLDATLRLYLNPDDLPGELPLAKMLTTPVEELKNRAKELAEQLRGLPLRTEVVETFSQMGSGALPLEKIPSVALKIIPDNLSLNRLARQLRLGNPAVIGYIDDDSFFINLRTVREDELPQVAERIKAIFT